MDIFLLFIYVLALLFIFLFSLGQLHLTWLYRRRKKQDQIQLSGNESLPPVTVQLPVYNEKYVVGRLIDCIAGLDYPSEKLEIQVLDDSTDETSGIIADRVAFWSERGMNIRHIQRERRTGFKAGALEYGLQQASGEFITIFDADFLPEPDFLLKSIAAFEPNIGVVQTRWGHINRDYSMLTRLQAFGLDAHFTVEQGGRSHANSFINFNGTAGTWRKSCILDAGGWSDDTLTEDLDLSYRAQLKGWKFRYLEDCVAPAELPVIMPAIKSQQYRWNKGAAETARKNLGKVLRANLPFTTKFHALFHLLNSAVFVSLLVAGILSVPVLFVRQAHPEWNMLFYAGTVFLLGFFSIGYFYWTASRATEEAKTAGYFFRHFPAFLVVSMGLSLHNGIAVLEGLMGRKTPFLRTPKFNVRSAADSWKSNKYIRFKLNLRSLLEGLMALYFMFGIAAGIYLNDAGVLIFHIMLAAGFAFVFYQSVQPFHGTGQASS